MTPSAPTTGSRAIFLSYAHEDTAVALRIAEALRAAGVEVWFDQSELRGGDAWDAKIKKQIRECALFLPLISAHTQERAEGYFRREWKLAVERTHDLADDVAFLVPVVVDDITDAAARVPEKFKEIQWTRLSGGVSPAVLVERVGALLSGAGEPRSRAEAEIHARARVFLEKQPTGFLAIVCVAATDAAPESAKAGESEATAPPAPQLAVMREVLGRFAPAEDLGAEGGQTFCAFTESAAAVKFALALHAQLRRRAKEGGGAVGERIGVHADEVPIAEGAAAGRRRTGPGDVVDRTARVAKLGRAGQVLLTRRVFDDARQALKGQDLEGLTSLCWVSHGHYTLGGDDEPVEICEVAEILAGALTPPPGTKGSRRTAANEHEPVLGWRPALGQLVPDTLWVLEKKLGEGGFGEVWLGRHQTMKERRVFKFCFHAERARSLKRELTLFRVLKERVGDHPNIVRLLEVHFNEPPIYVEMDFVEGQSLKPWCEEHGGIAQVPLADRLEIVAQIADALQAAHDAGVIHRDVKPGNILVSQPATPGAHPRAKLSDFGIGQVVSEEVLQGVTKAGFTVSVLAESSSAYSGTQLYMAPELFAGEHASPRSDLYSLGVVLYQLVVGDLRRPVTTDWAKAIDDPLLREDLARCFAGKPEERFARAGELAERLRAMEQRRAALAKAQVSAAAKARATRRWKLAWSVGLAAVVVALATSTAWFLQRNAKLRWAREVALPEIQKLVEKFDYFAAYDLAVQVEKYLPTDPALTSLWPKISTKISFDTTPPGAEIYFKEYRKPESEWRYFGTTPVKEKRMADVFYRWRVRKEGYVARERAAGFIYNRPIRSTLFKEGAIPSGMVSINAAKTESASTRLPSVQLEDFAIDRYEVTNRQFKVFIDRGGYSTPEYWKEPFKQQDKELTWEEAMRSFHDSTGRPGPATWANGTYPDDQADYPVTGISWFESAAYAEFSGKRLPSIYHWKHASLVAPSESMIPLSNFSGHGIAPVGKYQGISWAGVYDLAGNVREWCWNEATPGNRYLLGGGWSDPEYMLFNLNAESAFSRSSLNGFRCIKPISDKALGQVVNARYTFMLRDYAKEKPVGDEEFRIFLRQFLFDKQPLNERLEKTEDDPRGLWRRETVSINATYNNERLKVIVFLPKETPPPYQAVIYFPGSGARSRTSSDALEPILGTKGGLDCIVGSGRALIHPVYKGTYERGVAPWKPPSGPSGGRDWVVQVVKDFARAVDYLETRQDIRADKLAYLGFSWGGVMGGILSLPSHRNS